MEESACLNHVTGLANVPANPAVPMTILGAKNARQVEENVQAAERPLSDQESVRIAEALA